MRAWIKYYESDHQPSTWTAAGVLTGGGDSCYTCCMPHFGLMDADALGPERAALQRARLHIRGGKRRLRQGKIAAGIVTLYDALDQALEWYRLAGARKETLRLPAGVRPDSRSFLAALAKTGVLAGSFDYDAFNALAERALHEELPGYDYGGLVASLEGIMNDLGVMPFDDEDLPPEDPATF